MVKDKIAILGASGFIGMHLCKKLVDENIKILALIRNKLLNASFKMTSLCSAVFILIGSTDLILNGSIMVFN